MQAMKANELKPTACHFGHDLYKDDPEAVTRQAKALGLKYTGCAWIPHGGDFDEQECQEAIEVFKLILITDKKSLFKKIIIKKTTLCVK